MQEHHLFSHIPNPSSWIWERENATGCILCARSPDEIGAWAKMLNCTHTDEQSGRIEWVWEFPQDQKRKANVGDEINFIQNKLEGVGGGRGSVGVVWLTYCNLCPIKRPSTKKLVMKSQVVSKIIYPFTSSTSKGKHSPVLEGNCVIMLV